MSCRIPALAAISLSPFVSAAAAAQPVAPAADLIIVTAQLREQKSLDVPMALSVIGTEQLDRFGLQEFDELSRFVPGFGVQNQSPNNPGFVMRGITSDNGAATHEPRVSVFQDGISISKSRGAYVELVDIERVEIAKGPQTTLYGRGALIGAVNIVQNKARLGRTEAAATLSYGNRNALLGEVMVNIPLGDHVAVRLAGRVRQRDGYVSNLLGGEAYNSVDTKALRGSLHAEAGRFSVNLIGNYQRDRPAGTAFKSIAYEPMRPDTGLVLGDRGRNSGAALASAPGFEGNRPLGLDREVWGLTGIVRLSLDDRAAITMLTAYRRFAALEIFDADGISLPILTAAEDARGRQFSQEFRVTYDHEALSAFAGATYFHEEGTQRTPARFDERPALARLTGTLNRVVTTPGLMASSTFNGQLLTGLASAYGVLLPTMQAQAIAANLKSSHLETATNGSRTDALDLFGDVTLRLSGRFEVGAGLRYSHDDKRSSYTAAVLNGRSILGGFLGALTMPAAQRAQLLAAISVPGAVGIPPSPAFPVPFFALAAQPTAGNGDPDTAQRNSGGFSWRLTARYIPSAAVSVYLSYARGRRPDILSPRGPIVPSAPTTFTALPSETVDSVEIGAKGVLLDRTLFYDGAAFYYRYENFQTIVQQATQFFASNAGKAEAYGFEGQLRWMPINGVSLFAAYAYNHGRFASGTRSGNRFRLNPDHSASLGAILSAPAGAGRIAFSPSMTAQSRVFFDDDNDRPELQQPPAALVADTLQDEYQNSYILVNARLGYEAPGGAWRIEGYIENLFDRAYVIEAGGVGDGFGMPTFIAGAPRLFGISASFRFGNQR